MLTKGVRGEEIAKIILCTFVKEREREGGEMGIERKRCAKSDRQQTKRGLSCKQS